MTTDPFTSAGPKAEDTREKNAKRDGYGRYLIPQLPVDGLKRQIPVTSDGLAAKGDTAWTRATTFAKSISDTYTLSAWSTRMAVKGLASRADLVLAAAACPVTDKGTLDNIVEQAKDAAAARASANLGTAMHNLTQDIDQGRLTDISGLPESAQRDIRAYQALLTEHGIEMMPGMTERTVINNTFGIAGTFDRIVLWQGRPTVLDLKTGKDLQYGWNEIGIQLALYANADAIWDWDRGVFLPLPLELRRDVGLVIHLPVGRGVAELHEVSLEEAWEACELCAKVRKWRSTRKLARLITVSTPATPGAKIAVTPQMAADAAKAAERLAEVAKLERQGAPDDVIAESATSPIYGTPELDGLSQPLAPLAGEGQRGCSVCHRTGHKKGSPKCLGLNDPQFDDPNALNGGSDGAGRMTVEEAAAVPEHGCGNWTRDAITGAWVCGTCGGPAADPIVAASHNAQQDAALAEIGADPFVEQDEIADPFVETETPAVREPSWAEKLNAAASKAEIRDVRAEATAAGAWTPELLAVGLARLAKISEPAG